jgi:hypothetical protein
MNAKTTKFPSHSVHSMSGYTEKQLREMHGMMRTQQTDGLHTGNDATSPAPLSVDAQELEYVRQILAEAGYSGPIAPAACPLEDWVKQALASDDVATQLDNAAPNDRGAISSALGVDKTLAVVGDLLFAILPEETVVVALDLLKAEHARLVKAQADALSPRM